MEGAIIMTVIMTVPIAAIISNAVLRYKRIELEKLQAQNGPGLSSEEIKVLVDSIKKLKEENDTLSQKYALLEERLQTAERKMLGS